MIESVSAIESSMAWDATHLTSGTTIASPTPPATSTIVVVSSVVRPLIGEVVVIIVILTRRRWSVCVLATDLVC